MNKLITLTFSILLLCTSVFAIAFEKREAYAPQAVKVMSFNIRYDSERDKNNAWPYRKLLAFETINNFAPDIVGLQEVRLHQAHDVKRALSNYGYHGAGRDDGLQQGEQVPILYLKQRFELLQKGHFWLSEQPLLAGSKGWDAAYPRMVSWVLLKDKRFKDTSPLFVVNAHYDHIGEIARKQSSALIVNRIKALKNNAHVIVLGDFNSPPNSAPYDTLITQLSLSDAHASDQLNNVGTYHGFTGKAQSKRIDWLLFSGSFTLINANIVQTNKNGQYPSDHFPITATLAPTRSH
ncbi:endonuclease/exonuclease/phosphatase family protein [Thalassotalea agarivorans]|uniref:Metal-dependent hydrolase, endonuclease/exonuclease/phosphatase family n=1 Tax=Thalassotalea agarivorans TaxID=349064 RepID=A0A1I0AF80_THASX|nr:endonuclease/exonuclease/phosphatase family protein [Thalassotalea agarivorans]SES92940.1 Metal-dependent hydrolase, endonuclease/exonuclease/phosphatase family [Thalassotalea agarivorans]